MKREIIPAMALFQLNTFLLGPAERARAENEGQLSANHLSSLHVQKYRNNYCEVFYYYYVYRYGHCHQPC